MTARADTPQSRAMMAKRQDTAPKAKTKRGANAGGDIATARSRGTDTSNLSAAEMAEVISPDKPLTEKQRLFVQHWAKGDSIQSASARAGYADGGSVAYRLVKMPNVLKLKAQYAAAYEQTAEMDRKQVMDGLKESIEMAKLMSEPATMIQGWKVVAQMCGYMAPVETRLKVDVTGNVTMTRLTQMTDAELLEMIEKGAQPPAPVIERLS